MLAPQVPADVARELLPEPAGGDALEGADQAGQGDPGRVVHEQVDVVGFAVELAELGAEVRADVRGVRAPRVPRVRAAQACLR